MGYTRHTLAMIATAAIAWAAAWPVPAAAQGATNVVKLTANTIQTSIRVGDYYTQVLLQAGDFQVPSDDNGRKQLGQAILTAFGLGAKTRSLTISVVLAEGGQALPEIPLITYTFDGKKRLTNYERINSYLSPRWQLGASDTISVTLNYKYSEQATYDPAAITDNVKKLIPSDAVVTAISGPFIQGIASLATSVFQVAGSRSVTARARDDLLPFPGAVGARGLMYSIALPSGQTLGSVNATLVVSPSLIRPAILATQAGLTDLARKPGEDVAALSLDVAGAKKRLLPEVEGLPSYATMLKGPTPATVRDYCSKGNDTLQAYGVTTLDRNTVVYRSMLDAGFDPKAYNVTANTWRSDCFKDGDVAALTAAVGIDFVPVTAPLPPLPATEWPKQLKSAMGCWVTNQSGDWCKAHATAARAILEKAIGDNVQVGVMDLPGVNELVPVGRRWAKAGLLDAINGRAVSFGCFERGLVLVKDGQPYELRGEIKNDIISTLQVQKAPAEAAQCLD